jgi:two-component system, response regulator, stage 0 sporulation protein F
MLVIDDDESIVFALESYFASDGWTVNSARRLDSALDLLSTGCYTLVLTDLRLGGCQETEGLEIARSAARLRPATHVILLTAFGTPEIEDEARRIGVDAFLHKPLPLSEIAQVARRIITQQSQSSAAIPEESHPCPSTARPHHRNRSASGLSRPPFSSRN